MNVADAQWEEMTHGGKVWENQGTVAKDIQRMNDEGDKKRIQKSKNGYNNKEKLKININKDKVISALQAYFDYLDSNNKGVGNVQQVYDFNYYVEKTLFHGLFSDDGFDFYIENAYNCGNNGQKISSNGFTGNFIIDGEEIPVTVIIPAAANNAFIHDHNTRFNFAEDVYYYDKIRKNSRSEIVHTTYMLKFNRVNEMGSVKLGNYNLLIEFSTYENRETFANKYLKRH